MRQKTFFSLFLICFFLVRSVYAEWMIIDEETTGVFLTEGFDTETTVQVGSVCFGDEVEVVSMVNNWSLVHPPANMKYTYDAVLIDTSNQCLEISKKNNSLFLLSDMTVFAVPQEIANHKDFFKKNNPVGKVKKWNTIKFFSKKTITNPSNNKLAMVYFVNFPKNSVFAIKNTSMVLPRLKENMPLNANVYKIKEGVKDETKHKTESNSEIQKDKISVINKRLVLLNEQLENLLKVGVSRGLVQEMWGHYKNLKEEAVDIDPLSNTMLNLEKHLEYIELLYETITFEKNISSKYINAQQKSEDIFIQSQGLRGGESYVGDGIVSLSSVYNGKNKPKLFRLLHPDTKRTIGYLEPSNRFDFISLLGQRVGVVGVTKINPILGVKVLRPKQIDLLNRENIKVKPVDPYNL